MAKAKTGFDKELELSDELAAFMEMDYASRGEVRDALWDHIKGEELQNPKDRRIIIPDVVLKPLLGSKPLTMFEMTKKISKHFIG